MSQNDQGESGKRKKSTARFDLSNIEYDNPGFRVEEPPERPPNPGRKINAQGVPLPDYLTKTDTAPTTQGRFQKKISTISTSSLKYHKYASKKKTKDSWWVGFFKNCYKDENKIPSWEPPMWKKFCPNPVFPSYRWFAQTICIFIIGFLIWGVLWSLFDGLVLPGGKAFELAAVVIGAHFGGWVWTRITTLPALIGMLLTGSLMQNLQIVNIDSELQSICSHLRLFALVIILTRAGLDLDPPAMKKYLFTVLKLGLVPWFAEFGIVAVLTHYVFGLPWLWGFLLGSIIAAVSPAVVVPCLFRLREKGYGVAKGIPTLVLAVSGVDDAFSVAIFGILKGVMLSSSSLTYTIVQGVASVVLGVAGGMLWGLICKYIPERNDTFLVPIRVLMLLVGGTFAMFVSEHVGWGGLGPLAVVAAGFVAIWQWSEMGWKIEDNPVNTSFEIFWMLLEPVLFGTTGALIKINELDKNMVLVGGGVLLSAFAFRILVTAAIGFRSNLNTKEKFFVSLSWMVKAGVQAALGPVVADALAERGDASEEDLRFAETVRTLCIVTIVLSAPIGAILISISGPKLLSKPRVSQIFVPKRKYSHRPSMRDISIINEDDDDHRNVRSPDPRKISSISGSVGFDRSNLQTIADEMSPPTSSSFLKNNA